MRRRHNIFFLVIFLTLLSCSKHEETSIIPDKGAEIEFGKIATKAVKDATDITGFEVSIAATNATTGADYVSLLTNEPVTPNSDHTEWNYPHTQYWMDGIHYYFVASYSYDLDDESRTNIGKFTKEDIGEGVDYTVFKYSLDVDTTVKDSDGNDSNENSRVDIMTAFDYVYTNDEWTMQNVGLTFSHLLTKVNFRISQDINKDQVNNYYITKISLSNVRSHGIYSVIPVEGTFYPSWEMTESKSKYEKTFDNYKLTEQKTIDGETITTSTPLLAWGDDGLLLIPQDIRNGEVTIAIDYIHEYVDQSGEMEDYEVERHVEATIPAAEWESNKSITYVISIANPNQIIFERPKVEKWASAQSGSTIIIK